MILLELIGSAFLIAGVFFSLLGVVGLIRLPDTYSRLHASGKTGTLGVVFLCVGAGFIMPEAIPKVMALGLFIVFSGPVASHAIAAAVYRKDQASEEDDAVEVQAPAEKPLDAAQGTPPLATDQA